MTTLAFIGNVMLGRGATESVWGTALPLLRSADAVVANLECAIADPLAATVLRAGNVRCVSLANDHAMDLGEEGLLDTIDVLDRAGIAHTGAGRTLARAAAPAIVRLPTLTLGVVGLTDHEPALEATKHAAGTHYVCIEHGRIPRTGLAELAAYARERNADLIVLSVHWGTTGVTAPPDRFRDFAHAAIDAGFDVIHGHSAHVFQGVEIHRGRPIFYDTRDFLGEGRAESFLFLVDVEPPATIARLRLVPVRLHSGRAGLATGAESDAIRARMRERCAALGTSVSDVNGTLVVDCGVYA